MEKKKNIINLTNILIGIVVFLVVIFIAYIVLSALHIPISKAPIVVCQANNRSLALCCLVYHMDEGCWPAKDNWCDLIKSYADETTEDVKIKLGRKIKVYQCPKDEIGPCSYAMNENIPGDANELPDDLVLLFESTPGWNQIGGSDDVITDRHKRPGANIAFVNGHVEFVKPEDVPNLRWTVEENK